MLYSFLSSLYWICTISGRTITFYPYWLRITWIHSFIPFSLHLVRFVVSYLRTMPTDQSHEYLYHMRVAFLHCSNSLLGSWRKVRNFILTTQSPCTYWGGWRITILWWWHSWMGIWFGLAASSSILFVFVNLSVVIFFRWFVRRREANQSRLMCFGFKFKQWILIVHIKVGWKTALESWLPANVSELQQHWDYYGLHEKYDNVAYDAGRCVVDREYSEIEWARLVWFIMDHMKRVSNQVLECIRG